VNPRLQAGLVATTTFCWVQAAMLVWPVPRLWFDPLSGGITFGKEAPAPAMGLYGVLLQAAAAALLTGLVAARVPAFGRNGLVGWAVAAVLVDLAVILLWA
jgi:hypothetical protein